jgi:hypothetical protein
MEREMNGVADAGVANVFLMYCSCVANVLLTCC